MMKEKGQILGKVLMIITSTLLTLFFLELIVRWNEKVLFLKKFKPLVTLRNERVAKKKVEEEKISKDTFNIYYFGESTMVGEPYLNTIPILVEKMLSDRVEGKEIKWINMALAGWDMGSSMDLVKRVVDQRDKYFPSLVVIYAGHNNYLGYQEDSGFSFSSNESKIMGWISSRSRLANRIARSLGLYKLEIDDRKFFDETVINPEGYKEVVRWYEENMAEIVRYLKTNGVPVIISTAASNYADFEPNRSVYTGDKNKQEDFRKEMDFGKEAYEKEKYQEALGHYQRALKIDNRFAEANYMIGQVYRKMGKNEKAWDSFLKAVDNDMMPIRAVSEQNEYLLRIPESGGVRIVDAVEVLRKNSKDGLIGDNLMSDGHHPNLRGYSLISEKIAKKIMGLFPGEEKYVELTEVEIKEMFESRDSLFDVYTSRAAWLIRLSSWRYDPSQRLRSAENYINKAVKIKGENFYCYLLKMTIAYLEKDIPEAEKNYKAAEKINRKEARNYLRVDWINKVIKRALN